jgi:hypothetical protein
MRKSILVFLGVMVLSFGLVMTGGAFSKARAMFALPEYNIAINGTSYTDNMDGFYDNFTGIYHIYNPAPIFLSLQNSITITIPANTFFFFLKWDPKLYYSISFNNSETTPLTIGSLSLGGNISMSNPSNFVQAYLNGSQDTIATQTSYVTTDKLSWTNAGVDVVVGESKGSLPGPYGNWTYAKVELTNITIPTGVSTFTGEFQINPVPIPGALWLFGPALAGLIGLKRKYLG